MPQDHNYWTKRPVFDQGDWREKHTDWIRGYWESQNHAHRQLIITSIKQIGGINTILELGCNCGPNIALIKERLKIPEKQLAGIDINSDSVAFGKAHLPGVDFRIGNFVKLPWNDKSFDLVLCDASLMYVDRDHIYQTMEEIDRVTKKAVIIIDRFSSTSKGDITGHVWGRNYLRLLRNKGFVPASTKLTKYTWPGSPNWQRFGRLFIGIRPT